MENEKMVELLKNHEFLEKIMALETPEEVQKVKDILLKLIYGLLLFVCMNSFVENYRSEKNWKILWIYIGLFVERN